MLYTTTRCGSPLNLLPMFSTNRQCQPFPMYILLKMLVLSVTAPYRRMMMLSLDFFPLTHYHVMIPSAIVFQDGLVLM